MLSRRLILAISFSMVSCGTGTGPGVDPDSAGPADPADVGARADTRPDAGPDSGEQNLGTEVDIGPDIGPDPDLISEPIEAPGPAWTGDYFGGGERPRYRQADSARYVTDFPELTKYSYAAVDDESRAPAGLRGCVDRAPSDPIGEVTLQSDSPEVYGSADVQAACGEDNRCVIGDNVTVEIDAPLVLHSLVVRGGEVVWNDETQADEADVWLCAGYVVVEQGGEWDMNLRGWNRRAWIYIMNNGATHEGLRTRAFGSYQADRPGGGSDPSLRVVGRELLRTWSLLAAPLEPGSSSIQLMHDPVEMRWRVGDRIAIAPTERGMDDDAQVFFITAMTAEGVVHLDRYSNDSSTHEAARAWAGAAGASLRSAEVINLSRNIIITGDDFEEVPCVDDPDVVPEAGPGFGTSTQGCMCDGGRSSCTMGLHTTSAHGGDSEISNVRVEKCGQRGVEGKYCLHFHHMMNCSDGDGGSSCVSRNNAVEFSQQRGLVVHSTHHARVESNVFFDVRGANLYIEDGNEMLNTVAYNVAVCPWGDNGCTLPGTSNDQGDTSLNQSGLYMESPNNLLVGNRMANHFNGMFNNAGNGRGPAEGLVCGGNVPLGLWEGNTFHSSGRFGTYLLNGNFPRRDTGQSVVDDGYTGGDDACAAYDEAGDDRGLTSVILNHFDYGNAFVGQYGAGDIQYRRHVNIDNLNSIYWKETKTSQDGCSAHISDSYYADGSADLPDAMGAFIIENTTFDRYGLRANHHCDVGVTGYLCMPQYVLHDVTWLDPRNTWMDFDINNGETNDGGIFTLSPDNIAEKSNGASFDVFPPDYNSLVAGNFDYLLALDGADCDRARDVTHEGQDVRDRYSDGILCGAPLRALKVFTHDANPGDLIVEVFARGANGEKGGLLATQRVPHLNITDEKQGYSVPVVPVISEVPRQDGPYLHEGYLYSLRLDGGDPIPSDWVIDFGDLTVSNRWGEEFLHLEVAGRDCDDEGANTISSFHDRRFYSGGDFPDEMWGRGACSPSGNKHAKTTRSDCDAQPDPTANIDPAYGYATWRARLDAACSQIDCGPNGVCSARYLGTHVPSLDPYVPVLAPYQCACKPGWGGPRCDSETSD